MSDQKSALDEIKNFLTPTVKVKEAPQETEKFEKLTKSRIDRIPVPQNLSLSDKKTNSDRILSSATGDTVILEGQYGKVFEVTKITAFKIAGTTQTFKFKRESGAGHTVETDVSADDANDKESDGGMNVRFGDRIVIEVTGAVASSTVDYSISYDEFTFNR